MSYKIKISLHSKGGHLPSSDPEGSTAQASCRRTLYTLQMVIVIKEKEHRVPRNATIFIKYRCVICSENISKMNRHGAYEGSTSVKNGLILDEGRKTWKTPKGKLHEQNQCIEISLQLAKRLRHSMAR